MQVSNILNIVHDRRYQKRGVEPVGITLHRIGEDLKWGHNLGTPIEICHAFTGRRPEFADAAKATGNQLPYTFMVDKPGVAWQCLPIDEIGWHARRPWSELYIGLAFLGDFRYEMPTAEQWMMGIDVAADLVVEYKIDLSMILGHGEIEGAHDGTKSIGGRNACPGNFFFVNLFRRDVQTAIETRPDRDLGNCVKTWGRSGLARH